ncbi:hypothetical protein M404DRAFT_994028, partial [Pisolithus tinctorius Marx 270]
THCFYLSVHISYPAIRAFIPSLGMATIPSISLANPSSTSLYTHSPPHRHVSPLRRTYDRFHEVMLNEVRLSLGC